jgi:hypothetical protein
MENHPSTWGRHRNGPERPDNLEGHQNGVVRVATAKWLEELGAFPKPATHVHSVNIPLGGGSSP